MSIPNKEGIAAAKKSYENYTHKTLYPLQI